MKFKVISPRRTLFDAKRQLRLVEGNKEWIDIMRSSKDIKEWNNNRKRVESAFLSLDHPEKDLFVIMMLGYIDGIVFKPFTNERKPISQAV